MRLRKLPVALVLLVAGCDDFLLGVADYSAASCLRDPPLTYENFGRGFLGKWCVGCHSSLLRPEQRTGAPIGVDFDTWEGVRTWAWDIEERGVPVSGGMPPQGGASAEDREVFAEWLQCEVLPAAGRAP